MPARLKRASSAFLDSPVKPGNDGVSDGDVVIIMRPLIRAKAEWDADKHGYIFKKKS